MNFEWEAFIFDETTNEWKPKTSIGIDQSVSQVLNDSVTSPYSLKIDDKLILIPFKYGNNPTFHKKN